MLNFMVCIGSQIERRHGEGLLRTVLKKRTAQLANSSTAQRSVGEPSHYLGRYVCEQCLGEGQALWDNGVGCAVYAARWRS